MHECTPMLPLLSHRHRVPNSMSETMHTHAYQIAYLDLAWKGRHSHKNNENVWCACVCVSVLCIFIAHVEAIHRFSTKLYAAFWLMKRWSVERDERGARTTGCVTVHGAVVPSTL